MHTLNDHNLALGLDWITYPDIKSAKAGLPKGRNYRYALKEGEGEVLLAIVDDAEAKKTVHSGALLLACSGSGSSTALVHHTISPEQVWVCAVVNGLPVPGADILVHPSESYSTFLQLRQDMGDPLVYGDLPEARGSLSSLIDVIDPKDGKKAVLQRDSKALVILTVGILLALVTAAGGYFFYASQKAEKEQALAMQIAQAQAQARREEQKKLLEEHIKTQKETFLKVPSPYFMIDQWLSVLRSLPITYNGWSPTTILCGQDKCLVKWTRTPKAYPSSFTSLPTDAPAFMENELAVTTRQILQAPFIDIIPSKENLMEKLNDLAAKETTFALTSTPPSVVFSGVPQGSGNLSQQVSIGKDNRFTLTTSNILQLTSTLPLIDAGSLFLTNLDITQLTPLRNKYNIVLTGGYRFE